MEDDSSPSKAKYRYNWNNIFDLTVSLMGIQKGSVEARQHDMKTYLSVVYPRVGRSEKRTRDSEDCDPACQLIHRPGTPPRPCSGGHLLQRGKSSEVPTGGYPSGEVVDLADKSEGGHHEESSMPMVSFNICNAVLGAGVLGFPYCFKTCGLLLGNLTVLIVVLMSDLSLGFLLDAAMWTGKHTYEAVAEAVLGRLAGRASYFFVILMQGGCLVAYLNIVGDTLSTVAGGVVPPGAEPSRGVLMCVVVVMVFLPLGLMVKSEKSLGASSFISLSFIFMFAMVVVYQSLMATPLTSAPLVWWDSSQVLVSFPVICFGFTAHVVLLPTVRNLRNPTQRRVRRAVRQALVVCLFMYCIVGTFGYTAFRERTAGDLLRNFGGGSGTGSLLMVAIKVGFGLSTACTVPVVLLPLRDALVPLLSTTATTSVSLPALHFKLLTVGILMAVLFVALLVPNVEFVFGLIGASACVFLAFFGPAMIHLRQRAALLKTPGGLVVLGGAGGSAALPGGGGAGGAGGIAPGDLMGDLASDLMTPSGPRRGPLLESKRVKGGGGGVSGWWWRVLGTLLCWRKAGGEKGHSTGGQDHHYHHHHHHHQSGVSWWKWVGAWVLVLLGMTAATGGMSATLGAVIEEQAVVALAQDLLHVVAQTEAAQTGILLVRTAATQLSAVQRAVINLDRAQEDALTTLNKVQSVMHSVQSLEDSRDLAMSHHHRAHHHRATGERGQGGTGAGEREGGIPVGVGGVGDRGGGGGSGGGGSGGVSKLKSLQRTTHKPLILTELSLAAAKAEVNRSLQAVMAAAAELDNVKQMQQQHAGVVIGDEPKFEPLNVLPSLGSETLTETHTKSEEAKFSSAPEVNSTTTLKKSKLDTKSDENSFLVLIKPSESNLDGQSVASKAEMIASSKDPSVDSKDPPVGSKDRAKAKTHSKSEERDLGDENEREDQKIRSRKEKIESKPDKGKERTSENEKRGQHEGKLSEDAPGSEVKQIREKDVKVVEGEKKESVPKEKSNSSDPDREFLTDDKKLVSKNGKEESLSSDAPPADKKESPRQEGDWIQATTTTTTSALLGEDNQLSPDDGHAGEKGKPHSGKEIDGAGERKDAPGSGRKDGTVEVSDKESREEVGGEEEMEVNIVETVVQEVESANEEAIRRMEEEEEEEEAKREKQKEKVKASSVQMEGLEDMQERVNVTLSALLETQAVLSELGSVTSGMRQDRIKPKEFTHKIQQLSQHAQAAVNSTKEASKALNETVSRAQEVLQQQQEDLHDALTDLKDKALEGITISSETTGDLPSDSKPAEIVITSQNSTTDLEGVPASPQVSAEANVSSLTSGTANRSTTIVEESTKPVIEKLSKKSRKHVRAEIDILGEAQVGKADSPPKKLDHVKMDLAESGEGTSVVHKKSKSKDDLLKSKEDSIKSKDDSVSSISDTVHSHHAVSHVDGELVVSKLPGKPKDMSLAIEGTTASEKQSPEDLEASEGAKISLVEDKQESNKISVVEEKTSELLRELSKWDDAKNGTDKVEKNPLNATSVANAASSIVEAWAAQTQGFYLAKVAGANPRVAARAEQIALELGSSTLNFTKLNVEPPPVEFSLVNSSVPLIPQAVTEVVITSSISVVDNGSVSEGLVDTGNVNTSALVPDG